VYAHFIPFAEVVKWGNVAYEFFTYPDAQHWFFENNRPEYREGDAAVAWGRTVQFLKDDLVR